MNKLGIIVPYRNRESHLIQFKKEITEYLNKNNIEFELIIVEQIDNKPFNRGKLLNIGFSQAEKLGCNYVVFHDVDMLPVDVNYLYSTNPIHLVDKVVSDSDYTKEIFDTYFGGVTMFPTHLFKKTNGYPNEYWGWGFEDDELFKRCIRVGLNVDFKKHKNPQQITTALQFFGNTSYIKIKNKINFKQSIKISTTFRADIFIDETKNYDEWTIFSIPGWDLTLTYNSFGRYKFEFWDYNKKVYSITSKIKPSIFTNIEIEINPYECFVKMKQDGILIDTQFFDRKLLNYSKEEYFYIGNANPYRGNNFKEFYGYISEFKIWNDNICIYDLDFENYQWPNIKNKTGEIVGEVFDCEKRNIVENKYEIIRVPNRRKETFKLLEHSSNGFSNGKWAHTETRINQIKYIKNLDNSGLNNLKYELISFENNHIKVVL